MKLPAFCDGGRQFFFVAPIYPFHLSDPEHILRYLRS
jgi:hypothetical protein